MWLKHGLMYALELLPSLGNLALLPWLRPVTFGRFSHSWFKLWY
jgi:hypothetical protein